MKRRTSVDLLMTSHLALTLLFSGCMLEGYGGEVAPQTVADVVIGASPFISANDAAAVQGAIFRIILDKVPSGSRVTVFDAYNLRRITDFEIPSRQAFDLVKIRSKLLARNLLDVQNFWDGATAPGAGNGELAGSIRIPQFFDFIASSRLDEQPPAIVVLVGSALYLDERDGRFSMANGLFPTDDHLCVERKESVFGVADRRGQLKGARVHYAYLGRPWVSDLHEAPVSRFWSLFIEQQGGELATFAPDLPSVVDRMAQPDARSPRAYELQCPSPPKPEMVPVLHPQEPGESDWLLATELPFAEGPPSRSQGSLKIGIRWDCIGCDLDLYSRPSDDASELFYRNPRTEEGVYFKDFHSSPTPVHGFEWIEYLEPVDLAAVQAAVNFYGGQSEGGVSGEVRALAGGNVYRGTFRIEAGEGNRGAEGDDRASSRYWTVLDIGALLGLDKGLRRAARAAGDTEKAEVVKPVAAALEKPPATGRAVEPPPSRSAVPSRGVRILSPEDGATLVAGRGTPGPLQHPVDGDVFGFDQAEIHKFRLIVEVSISTDRWHPQGAARVQDDGTWLLPRANFGGYEHIVRAVLKDHNGNEIHSHEILVRVVH